ncbi:hypothetical protein A9Q99_19845 [Gammaproteobacteria bacterium 45_16_T64]|nr:hypothetical protein A9Q99_19845 [Gammaproteobacteria bacterium 45_16_T64]
MSVLHQIILVSLGGGLGASSRYLMMTYLEPQLNIRFPYALLSVNVLGSFLCGMFFVVIVSMTGMKEQLRLFLLVGFFGAFTTFATFSHDTVRLLEEGHLVLGVLNVMSNVFACLMAYWLGSLLAKQVF